jgi:hypothetical protein
MIMINQKKRAYHFETSSLLPLKLVLIKAERESPSHAPKIQYDVNEELALRLIAGPKKENRKVAVITRASARSNLLFKNEIASLTPLVRSDIKLEP